MNKINWAVIPVAGMGTRMLPMSKAFPKELVPVVDRPLIDWILDEVYTAGIKNVVFVSHPSKSSIEYYLTDHAIEKILLEKGKKDLVDCLNQSKAKDLNLVFVNQDKPLGLGHAINCARPIVNGQGFAVLLPDVLITQNDNCVSGITLSDMVSYTQEHNKSSILVEKVPMDKTSSYGIVALKGETSEITALVEKPAPENAPSNLAIVGRYIFTPGIWAFLGSEKTGSGGEIQLTDAIDNLLEKEKVFASVLQERTFDCGDKSGYLKAQLILSLESEAYGDSLRMLLDHQ